MKENNLLASVALFSALYNNDKYKSISDIIAEFIKGAVVSENKWTINSRELTNLLEKVYEFNIPESVVRTTVRNTIKLTATNQGHYVFDSSMANDYADLNDNYHSIVQLQIGIINSLLDFIDSKVNTPLSNDEKDIVAQNFKNYLLDRGNTDKYSSLISAFVIKKQDDIQFTQNLNLIREGVILYQGIRFTADLNELGKWRTELKIFLSTEHLFNALGYNGSLFQQIFDDFYNLVLEINSTTKNKYGEKLIELKYFQETREEVDAFFQTAEYILKGTATLDPSKTAMKSILEDCKTPSDIKNKRVKFDLELKKRGILYQEFSQSIYSYHDYVVEDTNTIESLKKEAQENQRPFDEQTCRRFMQIFTKINYFRGGESKTKFENIGNIFITGNRFALFLAHQTKVKFKEDDIPFAKDIDYITSKFWFKLKKGFGNKQSIPKSFDVITKAQIILSSQVNQNIYKEFITLQDQFRNGSLTKEEALERSYVLREKSATPEDVTIDSLDNALEFINNDEFFEDYFREKEKKDKELKQVIIEKEELQKELEKRIQADNEKLKQENLLKYNNEKEVFVKQEWEKFARKKKSDFFYYLMVTFMTFLPAFITLFLKGNKELNNKIEGLGSKQNWIWFSLALVFLFELFGRSYLFDKDKIKSGWKWLTLKMRQSSFNQYKNEKLADFTSSFDNPNRTS